MGVFLFIVCCYYWLLVTFVIVAGYIISSTVQSSDYYIVELVRTIMSELSFSLLCFNIDKKCNNKNIVSYLCDAKPDLCFLQEITTDEVKKHDNTKNTRWR